MDSLIAFLVCTIVYGLMFYTQHRRTVLMRDKILKELNWLECFVEVCPVANECDLTKAETEELVALVSVGSNLNRTDEFQRLWDKAGQKVRLACVKCS